jgi:hypothetical protein
MSTIKAFANGTFQLRVSSKLLDKPLYATFDTLEQAQAYGTQLEGLLAQGIVPKSLLERTKTGQEIWTVSRCICAYLRENSVPVSDIKLLHTLRPLLASASTGYLNYDWAEGWVRRMKRIDNLSPSTIRHRHGALARCCDRMLRKHPGVMAQNPLRLLKRGFATYTDEDRKQLIAAGKTPKWMSSGIGGWMPRKRRGFCDIWRRCPMKRSSLFSRSNPPCACANAIRCPSSRSA